MGELDAAGVSQPALTLLRASGESLGRPKRLPPTLDADECSRKRRRAAPWPSSMAVSDALVPYASESLQHENLSADVSYAHDHDCCEWSLVPRSPRMAVDPRGLVFVVDRGRLIAELPAHWRPTITTASGEAVDVGEVAIDCNGTAHLISADGRLLMS